VETIDKASRGLVLDDGSKLAYDTLVLATGARHAYFGHDDWEAFAPGLKTLDDATNIRGRILLAFEEAERELDERKQAALMTFIVVGTGPTGVELAGTIAELARATLPGDFRRIDTRKARIVLIEAGSRVLQPSPRICQTMRSIRWKCLGLRLHFVMPFLSVRPRASSLKAANWPRERSSGRLGCRPRRPRSGWRRPPTEPAASWSRPI
jgi:NADH dehydrogenase FAD-containing subunit